MEITERVFGITGIMEQLFGSQKPSERSSFLKTNPAWRILETVYNYAVEAGFRQSGLVGVSLLLGHGAG